MTNYAERMNALAKEYIKTQKEEAREKAQKYFELHVLPAVEDAARHGKLYRVFAISNFIDMYILEEIVRDAGFIAVTYPHREMRITWEK